MARPRKPQKLLGIERRGESYSYRLRVPDPAKPQGSKQVRFGGFATPEEADKDRAKRKIELYERRFVLPAQMTVRDFFPESLERHFIYKEIRPQTCADYRLHLTAYILPRIGHLLLQECSTEILESLFIELQKSGSKLGTELSGGVLEKISIVLGIGFKEAHRKRLLGFNPMTEVRIPKGSKKKIAHFSDIELRKLQIAWQKSKFADFFELASVTGARKGELFALRWSDFDEQERTLSISKTLYDLGNERVENSPKSPNSVRKIEVTTSQSQRLKAYKARQTQARLKAGAVWRNDDYLFTDEIGRPLSKDSVYYEWRKICRKAGVGLKHLHALRHTHITALLQAGVQPYVVAQRAGDKVITILTTYAHAIREDDSACAELFERKMASL